MPELPDRLMPDTDTTRVLVVDDEAAVSTLLERLLTREGYAVHVAADGESALAEVADFNPDVILLDVVFPGGGGFAICRQLKRDVTTRLTPVILVTGLTDRDTRINGREAGADDFLTKPVDPQELLARVASLARLKRYTDDLDSAASIITTLATMIEARDGYTEGHCHRMANYATAVGRALGVGALDLQALHRGGFIHDIGMLAISPTVVLRPAHSSLKSSSGSNRTPSSATSCAAASARCRRYIRSCGIITNVSTARDIRTACAATRSR